MSYLLRAATAAGGVNLGELRNAGGPRRLRFPLGRIPTVSFTVDADHPLAPYLDDVDKLLVKAYERVDADTRPLRFIGPVTSRDKSRDASGGTISAVASGPAWRLGHRLIGKNAAGATFGTTAVSLLDRGEIAARTVEAVNRGDAVNIYADAGDTGIRRGTITPSSSTFVGPWRYRPALDVVSELAAPLDGYDWEVAPTEPTVDADGLQIGALNVAPVIGGLNLDAAFEFGTGRRNVESWRDAMTADGLANRTVSLPSGYPDNAVGAVLEASDAASIADRGLHEALVASELIVDSLRTKLLEEHVRIRKTPRRVISFQPVAEDPDTPLEQRRVPRLHRDFIVGDVVPFRAVERFPTFDAEGMLTGYADVKTVDALFRIYVADLELDDAGVAKPTLTLVEEE